MLHHSHIQGDKNPSEIPGPNLKGVQRDILHLHFDDAYRELARNAYLFPFDHLSHDFPNVNSLTMYAFLMYANAQAESPDKHRAICNYLYFMDPYMQGADALIHWHLTRALQLDPANQEVLGWILSVYDGNPDCPFAPTQLEQFRKTYQIKQSGGNTR